MLIMPQTFLECGVADFILCGCLPFAKKDEITGVTKRLNGGTIGLDQRRVWLGKWKQALK
jgi:putative chitinase